MEHEEDEREAGQPTPNRGPLRFVDNGTGKRRFRLMGKKKGLDALLERQRGKGGSSSPVAREGSNEGPSEKTQAGRAVTRPKPKGASTAGATGKQSQKAGTTASSADTSRTVANVDGGCNRDQLPRGNTAGKAWVLMLMAVVLGFAAYASVRARGERIAELFPDQALQEYIQEEVDSNGDGRLSEEEILEVRELDGFQDRGIKSLAGLEMFSNLERLDASGAGAEEIFRVHRRQWSIFRGETTKKEIRTHFLENLTTLDLSDNELSGEIDFCDSCPNLVDLNISNNNLEGMELASGATIESFDCSHNAFEGRLYLKPGIKNLNCAGNKLVQIVITSDLFESNGPLDSLYCQDNQLVSMLDGNNPFPYDITVVSKDKVDISNNPGIWIDNVRENGIVEIGYAKLNP